MNKIQKGIAILLIIGVVVFVAGCASQSPKPANTSTTEKAGGPAKEHPDQSKEWMQVTSADALNISNAANALIKTSQDGSDSQKIISLMTYTEEEANTSSYKSANYYVNADLEPSQQKYADMMGSYGAVAKRMKMTIDYQNAGNTASAQMTFKDAQASLERGNAHYAEYKAMIEDFNKKHPEMA